jgi:ribosome biogenesis protein Tsr3
MARCGSVSDDLMNLSDADSDLFQRMGILAAFDSWERAKKFVE